MPHETVLVFLLELADAASYFTAMTRAEQILARQRQIDDELREIASGPGWHTPVHAVKQAIERGFLIKEWRALQHELEHLPEAVD